MLKPALKRQLRAVRGIHVSASLLNRKPDPKITVEHPDEYTPMDSAKAPSTEKSSLFYAYRSEGEVFGQLVSESINGRNPLHNKRVVTEEEAEMGVDPRYRDPETGELLEGATSKEARLAAETLEGRVNHSQIQVPPELSEVIQNNMLYAYDPKYLKQEAASYYVDLNERQGLQKRTETEKEADVSIATMFAQNYATAYQVLDELVRRVGGADKFHPKSVLDYTSGPAVGMLALNELMGESFNPEAKDAFIGGTFYMSRRAKLLLSRQPSEYNARSEEEETEEVTDEKTQESAAEPYVGPVKTKDIHIKTILLDKLRPTAKKYELIICEGQLLGSKEEFPYQIDQKLDDLVSRLAPGGHLVILERGNPLGAETIARARQVILRPENHEGEVVKEPREYKSFRSQLAEKVKDLEEKGALGTIEPELLQEYSIEEVKEEKEYEPLNLKVLAPCAHHGACPLQFFKPEYYEFGQIGKKLKFCNFSVNVARPAYLIELKKGAKLATKWTSENSGVGIKGLAKPGKGRPFGVDYETANYSYLIVERSAEASVDSIDTKPRILAPPLKRKGLVTMDVCSPSGHVEKLYVSKSVGKKEYHDARKARMGDIWALGMRSSVQSKKENTFYFDRLETKEKNIQRKKKMDSERLKRKIRREYKEALAEDKKGELGEKLVNMARIDSYRFLVQPKEQQKLKDNK